MSGIPKINIKPFQNDSESVQLNGLTIENMRDKVAFFGSIDISLDKEGLQKAQVLKTILDSVVVYMNHLDLPERIKKVPTETIKNPFS
jgi:hypothetical protein